MQGNWVPNPKASSMCSRKPGQGPSHQDVSQALEQANRAINRLEDELTTMKKDGNNLFIRYEKGVRPPLQGGGRHCLLQGKTLLTRRFDEVHLIVYPA